MASDPIWVRNDVVLAIHGRQLAEHGGTAGIRDAGMLESALARPKNLLAYSSPPPDLAQLAASYAFGIVKNHPFVDGNKRTAHVVCRTFLLLNGYDIQASREEKYALFMQLASGEVGENELAATIRKWLLKVRETAGG